MDDRVGEASAVVCNVVGDRQAQALVDQSTSGQGNPVGWTISSVVVWLVGPLFREKDVKRTVWDLCP